MTAFENTLTKSKAINRFMHVERLSQDAIYELYSDCFFAYRDMFMERIRFGAGLSLVISTYSCVPMFRRLSPRKIQTIVFNSPVMHQWFAFRFWQVIERQVTTGQINKADLLNELTFINQIPTALTMEEILRKSEPDTHHVRSRKPSKITPINQLTLNL